MRIISGKAKGACLKYLKNAPELRPTMDRIKEVLFNSLELFPSPKFVLDLCAGTGSLGLEAFSRFDCQRLILVDSHYSSCQMIQENLKIIEKYCPIQAIDIVQENVFTFLEKFSGSKEIDLILADPPYNSSIALQLLNSEKLALLTSLKTVFVIEHLKSKVLESEYWYLVKEKNFKDKSLSFFKRKG